MVLQILFHKINKSKHPIKRLNISYNHKSGFTFLPDIDVHKIEEKWKQLFCVPPTGKNGENPNVLKINILVTNALK